MECSLHYLMTNSRNKRRRPGNKTLADALRCTDTLFISFLEGCLRWNISERLTPEEAMQHKWIQEGHMTMSSYRGYKGQEGNKRSPYGAGADGSGRGDEGGISADEHGGD